MHMYTEDTDQKSDKNFLYGKKYGKGWTFHLVSCLDIRCWKINLQWKPLKDSLPPTHPPKKKAKQQHEHSVIPLQQTPSEAASRALLTGMG